MTHRLVKVVFEVLFSPPLVPFSDLDSMSVSSLETVPASRDPAFDTRGEHEASDVVDQDSDAQVEPEVLQDIAGGQRSLDEIVEDAHGGLQETAKENVLPASTTDLSKKADVSLKGTIPSKDKSTVLAKSASGKASSSPLTDKKVC